MLFVKDITNNNINDAISFCLPYEAECINLVSHLLKLSQTKEESTGLFKNLFGRESKKNSELKRDAKIVYFNEKIIGIFCINFSNIFVYCVNLNNAQIKSAEVYNLLLSEFNFSKIFAIMGEAVFQIGLLKHLTLKCCVKNAITAKYILMTRLKNHSILMPYPLLKGVKLRKASINDASAILPIQRLYEEEEVCKENERISERFSLLNLEKILREETVFIATYNGEVLAKANTNSRSLYWEQIGGIYTAKKYRRLLIGSSVVATLIDNIQNKKNKNTALFVRQENETAIKMYQKLLFRKTKDFYITYLK